MIHRPRAVTFKATMPKAVVNEEQVIIAQTVVSDENSGPSVVMPTEAFLGNRTSLHNKRKLPIPARLPQNPRHLKYLVPS